MNKQCAWCNTPLGMVEEDCTAPISHGICETCATALLMQPASVLRDTLARLTEPVFLVDEDGRVRTSSPAAVEALGKDIETIEGVLGGDVMECVYASEPGGCGNTIHCAACTIRNAVNETRETRLPKVNIPATLNTVMEDRRVQIQYRISTEPAGQSVLLRIDAVDEVIYVDEPSQ